MDQYIGKMLDDRYELLEVIGTGGMAVVYKGRDHRLNRLVAVKILREDLARDAEFRRRFHDESQAVAMLSHPNIMAVYDVSRSGDTEYIVMELIDGITLKQYIQRRGGVLTWKEALHFITQIIKALSHAHSRGIIHRDIKPQNIMVLRDGSIKVTDFGIARLASAGFGRRLLFSHDLFLKSMLRKHGGNGLSYVPAVFLDRLTDLGVDAEIVHGVGTRNVRDLFEGAVLTR